MPSVVTLPHECMPIFYFRGGHRPIFSCPPAFMGGRVAGDKPVVGRAGGKGRAGGNGGKGRDSRAGGKGRAAPSGFRSTH